MLSNNFIVLFLITKSINLLAISDIKYTKVVILMHPFSVSLFLECDCHVTRY